MLPEERAVIEIVDARPAVVPRDLVPVFDRSGAVVGQHEVVLGAARLVGRSRRAVEVDFEVALHRRRARSGIVGHAVVKPPHSGEPARRPDR